MAHQVLQPRGQGASTAADGGSVWDMAKFGGDLTMMDLRTSEMVGRRSNARRGTSQARALVLSATAV